VPPAIAGDGRGGAGAAPGGATGNAALLAMVAATPLIVRS
jgi:hypothetical protein